MSIVFQQQDSVVSACATIALWSALQKPTKEFGYYLPTPFEITQTANEQVSISRPIPSSGLEIRQIINTIRYHGMEVEVKDYIVNDSKFLNPESFISLCYAYLRGGFPIFLGLNIEDFGYHAVTILGYQLTKRKYAPKYTPVEGLNYILPLTGSKISEFYIHDDNIGPFARFYTCYTNKTLLVCENYTKKNTEDYAKITPTFLVIPLYHKIRLNYNDIREYLFSIDYLIKEFQIIKDEKISKTREWDCYLVDVNNYKRMVLNDNYILPIPEPTRTDLLKVFFPRFIWRCTFLINDVPYLELLADATEARTTFPFVYMFFFDSELRDSFKLAFTSNNIQSLLDDTELNFPNSVIFSKIQQFLAFIEKWISIYL